MSKTPKLGGSEKQGHFSGAVASAVASVQPPTVAQRLHKRPPSMQPIDLTERPESDYFFESNGVLPPLAQTPLYGLLSVSENSVFSVDFQTILSAHDQAQTTERYLPDRLDHIL